MLFKRLYKYSIFPVFMKEMLSDQQNSSNQPSILSFPVGSSRTGQQELSVSIVNLQSHSSNEVNQPIHSQYPSPQVLYNYSSTGPGMLIRSGFPNMPRVPIQALDFSVLNNVPSRLTRRIAHDLAFGVVRQQSPPTSHLSSGIVGDDDAVVNSAGYSFEAARSTTNYRVRQRKVRPGGRATRFKATTRGRSISSLLDVRGELVRE